MDLFDEAWDTLAKKGQCDERGSAEYIRCRRAWHLYGYMGAALHFIVNSANTTPPAPTPEQPPGDGKG